MKIFYLFDNLFLNKELKLCINMTKFSYNCQSITNCKKCRKFSISFSFYVLPSLMHGGGGGGFTRPIPRDGGADQFRGIPIVGRLPMDGTRGPEEKGCGRKWPDAEGLVQGSRARDVRDPVVQNHSCCKKESRLDQLCGDKS